MKSPSPTPEIGKILHPFSNSRTMATTVPLSAVPSRHLKVFCAGCGDLAIWQKSIPPSRTEAVTSRFEKMKMVFLLRINSRWDGPSLEERIDDARQSCTRLKSMKLDSSLVRGTRPGWLSAQSQSSFTPEFRSWVDNTPECMPNESELVKLGGTLETVLKSAAIHKAKMSHYRLAAYVKSLSHRNTPEEADGQVY